MFRLFILILLFSFSCSTVRQTTNSSASMEGSGKSSHTSDSTWAKIQTVTRHFGDTLTAGFVLPFDSVAPPVWLESTGLRLGVDAKMTPVGIRLNVSAISKPRAETHTDSTSGVVREGNTDEWDVSVRQSSRQDRRSSTDTIWILGLTVAIVLIIVFKLFKT